MNLAYVTILLCAAIALPSYAQNALPLPGGNADWDVVWVNYQPEAADPGDPNGWMAGTNQYTGLAYDKWNDVIYIVNPAMCWTGDRWQAPCPNIFAWEAETGQPAKRIVNALGKSDSAQLYVNAAAMNFGYRYRPFEAYPLFRIDLDDEGRIYATNISGVRHYPLLTWQPFRIYRWDTYSSDPVLLVHDNFFATILRGMPMIGTSLEVVGKRLMNGGVLVDSTRVFVSGCVEEDNYKSELDKILLYQIDTSSNAAMPYYNSMVMCQNQEGSYMAAHGIAATGTFPESQLYMDANARQVILNNQGPVLSLNLPLSEEVTGHSGVIKYYYDAWNNRHYLVCVNGMPTSGDPLDENFNTTARVVDLSETTKVNWPGLPTPRLGNKCLHNITEANNNWVSDVDYKIWINPVNGNPHLQLFVLMSNNGIGCYRTHDPLYIPVEFSTFRGIVEENRVLLAWQVASETNNFGFEVYRSLNNGAGWELAGIVPGRGTTASAHEYMFSDPLTPQLRSAGNALYRLKQIDFDGAYEWTPSIDVIIGGNAETIALSQNYPNPCAGATAIWYQLQSPARVSLKVYNVLGLEVATIADGEKPAGQHKADFDATHLPPGAYIYRLVSNGTAIEKTMMVTK